MNLLKLLIIPLLLTLGYVILLSYPYLFSKINRFDSLGLLSVIEEKSEIPKKILSVQRTTDQYDNHLFKGEKITSKIKATEDNFGILLFRFAKLSSRVSDEVVFRIKEEGESNWYYENTYKANQFQPDQYFTFGFPPFKESKNNSYIFEIESLQGNYKNGVGISPHVPQMALVYKYSREDLKRFDRLSSFLLKKTMYVTSNVNFLQNWQILGIFLLSAFFSFYFSKLKIDFLKIFTLSKKERGRNIEIVGKRLKSAYFSTSRSLNNFNKRLNRWFTSTYFYLKFLDTDIKKRVAISLLIFLFALLYRFSSTLVNQHLFFYAGLGGQGDYDQFIRAATCALSFCSAILGQNFLFESTILGIFFNFFGFTGGLKAYLYLMIVISSIVATLPHLLLSRKSWVSLGGIFGSLYLATSDFLTHMSLNFTPDNGSLFTFSMFFIIYFLTLQKGTLRWLLFLGLMGGIDALNKALFILNDLVALGLFIPVFFFEKIKEKGKPIFKRENVRVLLLASVPLLVLAIIYTAWEILVYVKFSAYYFLRGLIETGGKNYVYYTTANDSSFLVGGIIFKLFYLAESAMVMVKRLIDYADLRIFILAPIFLSMLFLSFAKEKFPLNKLIIFLISSAITILLLTFIKNNYFNLHEIFAGEYVFYTWTNQTYLKVFLLIQIVMFFVLKFGYSSLKLALPILPYIVMLIVLTKNSPFPRISTQVVAWMIILLSFIINWIFLNTNRYHLFRMSWLAPLFLILFIYFYIAPKTLNMTTQFRSGVVQSKNTVEYLKWVNSELPNNAVVLAGGKSDLVTVGENIQRPIVYSALYAAAILINPDQIPGTKSSDFGITGVQFLKGKIDIPKVGAADFSIVKELQNKENFKKKKYIVLEDDIYIWRSRVSGVADNLFSTSLTTLRSEDYSIKVYKFNPKLKKAIYELNFKEVLD